MRVVPKTKRNLHWLHTCVKFLLLCATCVSTPQQQLSLQQLRQQIARLERHIFELPQEGFGQLRDSPYDSLAATIQNQNLKQTKESLRLATTAYEQTKIADDATAQEVQKNNALPSRTSSPLEPTATLLPAPTMVGLYQIMRQLRLHPRHHLLHILARNAKT